MNNWNPENYPMQHGMGMNMMQNGPLLPLPTPMYTMPDVPPINPPPPMPAQLLNDTLPDTTNQDSDTEAVRETDVSDASGRSKDRRRRSRERSSSQRRERGRDRSDRRSNDCDHNRSDRDDRLVRNRGRHQKERQSKWDRDEKEIAVPIVPGTPNMQANMMIHPGIAAFQNMMANNMLASNMMQNMPNIIMQQAMEHNQMPPMMAQMNMLNNMMPNMMDQSMMMNQQMMPIMTNQPMFVGAGVILPPVPGHQIPPCREKPKGCRTIFIGGLPKGMATDSLIEIFQRFGPVENIKTPRNNAYYLRFQRPESVEQSLALSGYRFKLHNQLDNEATTIFVDYAVNRDDQNEYEKQQRQRQPTPPRVEPFSTAALNNLAEKIKIEDEFVNYAPTLAAWLERGECAKKNANTFYSLIQVSNNQSRRLFNEKMQLDDEFQLMKTNFREKFSRVLVQLEHVAKILSVAKHQRVSDHFTKQQRRNIDMWLKMTEEVENFKEEVNCIFQEDETEKNSKNVVPLERYEELKMEIENLTYELEGYKNEAHLAKGEAERKFETFKAHFVAQQALKNKPHVNLAFQPLKNLPSQKLQPPLPDSAPDGRGTPAPVPPSEAKLISILTPFLMVHPLGASLDYLTSYVKSMTPNVAQIDVQTILQKYEDVFQCKVTGVGASIEHRWTFVTFDAIKAAN